MFNYTKAELSEIANKQNFIRDTLEKVVRLSEVLDWMRDNIKVEINYSLRSYLFELEDKPVLSDVIHMEHLITVLSPVELFAAKINALLSRAAARDLYDTYNMIDMGLFSKDEYEMLRKSAVFYTAISQEEMPEKYDVSVIDRISIRKSQNLTFNMIDFVREWLTTNYITDIMTNFLKSLYLCGFRLL